MQARLARTAALTAVAILAAGASSGQTNRLLVIGPAAWQPALTNWCAFKQRLGHAVATIATETIAGGGSLTPAALRAFLQGQTGTVDSVLLVGDFEAIPAPSFRVQTGDSTAFSDLPYRDLHTDFDTDGDGVYGEYGAGQDFTDATFPALFPAISNDLIVARLPLPPHFDAAQVETALAVSTAYEREVSPRKNHALLTAGRISLLLPADSWDYAVKPLAQAITNAGPGKRATTVAQVSAAYTDFSNLDYPVVSDNLSETQGQEIVRALWEDNNDFAFLCNVSHGGPRADFALTTRRAGLPRNVDPAIVISMSCASYPLGVSAFTSGVAVAYFGSTAVVTPDIPSLVSAGAQDQAVTGMFASNAPIGRAFTAAFDMYVRDIQGTLYYQFPANWPGILRNVIGYQIIGDPTLVHGRTDTDDDGLLDAEESTLGTGIGTPDSDGDDLRDGDEVYVYGTGPTRADTDADGAGDGDECVAGTDPRNPADFFGIDGLSWSNGQAVVEWSGVSGRVYRLLASSRVPTGGWAAVEGCSNVAGRGGPQALSAPSAGEHFYYRLGVQFNP